MISTEKPGTPQDLALEHHGVLGMRWGHRKEGGGRAANTRAKEAFIRKNPSSRKQASAIRIARASTHLDITKYANAPRRSQKRKDLRKVTLRNPDRATALRLTRGEKVVAAIIAVGLPGVGTAAVGSTVGTQVAVRRHIERKQARGGYG